MGPEIPPDEKDTLLPEYDFSRSARGKPYRSYWEGTNVRFLDPDVAKVFTHSRSVNRALRLLLKRSRGQDPGR